MSQQVDRKLGHDPDARRTSPLIVVARFATVQLSVALFQTSDHLSNCFNRRDADLFGVSNRLLWSPAIRKAAMRQAISRAAVRRVDELAIQVLGMPGLILMENAARGCADWLVDLNVVGPVTICAGKGNNAGDGFVIARHLENLGIQVQVLLFARPEQLLGDAATNFSIIKTAGSQIVEVDQKTPDQLSQLLSGSRWIIDALLGTGTQGELREPYRTAIPIINRQPAQRFAIDLPSGMDCDSGDPISGPGLCVKADYTATFVAPKLGFKNPDASTFLGETRVIDIGVPHKFLERILRTASAG